MYNNIVIIGGGGAIGSAFTQQVACHYASAKIHAFSRQPEAPQFTNVIPCPIDYTREESLAEAAHIASRSEPVDLVFIATGLLHQDDLMPEKSLKQLSAEQLSTVFAVNTILPALLIKHFVPHLSRNQQSVIAALSARVGSITDNRLGGWYAYRASKAGLNMIIKCAAIEARRLNKLAVIVGLHPGTVKSPLSQPFQANVPRDKLFTPDESAQCLLSTIKGLNAAHSGKCFAWNGEEIAP